MKRGSDKLGHKSGELEDQEGEGGEELLRGGVVFMVLDMWPLEVQAAHQLQVEGLCKWVVRVLE